MTSTLRRQLKLDVQNCLKVGGLPVFLGGLELNFLRGVNCGFVQSVTKATHNFNDANLPVGGKDDIEQNFAFNLKLSALIRVDRAWLECYLYR